MVTTVVVPTAFVVTVNFPDVAPLATLTIAGTVAAPVFELERVIVVPVEGAGPVRVTVPPTTVLPPTAVFGETAIDLTVAGITVREPDVVEVPCLAVTVADTFEATALVVMLNVADEVPPATFTDAGTVTLVELEVSVTVMPAAGAGEFSVTVPVAAVPPVTVDGAAATVPTPGA